MNLKRHSLVMAVVLLLAALPLCAFAQQRKVMNRPYIDQRRLHWGFHVGLHLQDIELANNGFTDEAGNQWFAEAPNYEPGFTVGILGEMKLHKHIALRLLPTMHFGTKNITFRNSLNSEREYQSIRSTYLTVPIDVKFSAERFNNYRPYAVLGVSPSFDLTIKKQQQLLMNRFDCYLEIGMGCDFYSPWFKFIPEIKFCWGLLDMINHKRHDISDPSQMIYTNSVNSGRSKMFVLTFYFE